VRISRVLLSTVVVVLLTISFVSCGGDYGMNRIIENTNKTRLYRPVIEDSRVPPKTTDNKTKKGESSRQFFGGGYLNTTWNFAVPSDVTFPVVDQFAYVNTKHKEEADRLKIERQELIDDATSEECKLKITWESGYIKKDRSVYVDLPIGQTTEHFFNLLNKYKTPIQLKLKEGFANDGFMPKSTETKIIEPEQIAYIYFQYTRTLENANKTIFKDIFSCMDIEFVTDIEGIAFDYDKMQKIDVYTYPVDLNRFDKDEKEIVWTKFVDTCCDFVIDHKVIGNVICTKNSRCLYGSCFQKFVEFYDVRDGRRIRNFPFHVDDVIRNSLSDYYFEQDGKLYIQCSENKEKLLESKDVDPVCQKETIKIIYETKCFDINTCEEIPVTEEEYMTAYRRHKANGNDRYIELKRHNKIIQCQNEKVVKEEWIELICTSFDGENVFWTADMGVLVEYHEMQIVSQDNNCCIVVNSDNETIRTLTSVSMKDGSILTRVEYPKTESGNDSYKLIQSTPYGALLFGGTCSHGDEMGFVNVKWLEMLDTRTLKPIYKVDMVDELRTVENSLPFLHLEYVIFDNFFYHQSVCIDLKTGKQLWKGGYDYNTIVYKKDNNLVLSDHESKLTRINMRTGEIVWQTGYNHAQSCTRPKGDVILWYDMWVDYETGVVLGKMKSSDQEKKQITIVSVNPECVIYVDRNYGDFMFYCERFK